MKTRRELLKALGRLAVETGSLACLDCGWEHDCGVHGCAILRDVRSALEEAEACAAEAEAANHQLAGDLSRDATKMVPLTLEQLRRRVEEAERPVVVFVVTIDPDTGERDFDGEWEMFDGDDFVADGTWDTYANYGVIFEAYAVQPKPSTDRSAPGR